MSVFNVEHEPPPIKDQQMGRYWRCIDSAINSFTATCLQLGDVLSSASEEEEMIY